MGTTIGGKEIATDKSDHKAVSPPAVSNIPPMTPLKPDGVPAPFPYMAETTSASGTASKLTVAGGKAVVDGSGLDVAQPGNQASQPAPLHDLVTQAVNKKCTVTSGSGKVTAGGKGISTTTDRAAMNVMSVGSQVSQQTGTLVAGGGADASSADSKSSHGNGQTVGEPVSVATGEVVDEVVDLSLPGLIPLEWKRIYASAFCDESTALGRGGWTFSLNQWIEDRGGELVLRCENGRNLHVAKMGVRETRFVRSKRIAITRQLDDTYEVFDLDRRLRRVFRPAHAAGRALLRSIRDAWGNEIAFTFDGERLARIVDTASRELRFEHDDAGRILAIAVWSRGAECQRVRYAYSPAGELAAATDPCGNAERYAYDGKHRLIEKTRKNGVRFYYAYDDKGRCTNSWGDGDIHRVELLYDLKKRTTTTVNTLEPRIFHWDAKGNVIREQTFDGNFAVDNVFDEDGFPIRETNAAGEARVYEYDARGNLFRGTDPAGNATTFEFVNDVPAKKTGPTGLVTRYEHDAWGALVAVHHPTGVSWSFAYDERGRMMSVRSRDGEMLRLEYDEQHNVVCETDGRGATTRYTCDVLGRVVSVSDSFGRVSRADYDGCGRPRRVTFADGSTSSREYDALGHVARIVDQLGQQTRFVYEGTGRLVKQELPDGSAWSFEYDLMERLRAIVNPKLERYEYAYDRAGNVEHETTFDGRRIAYHYTRAQRVGRIEYPDDTWRAFQYDRAGRVAIETSPHGVQRYVRNAVGQIVEATVEEGPVKTVVACKRDAFGRVVEQTQNGHAVHYAYDDRGRPAKRVLGSGETTTYEFDPSGEVASVTHDGCRVHFDRDVLGRETRRHLFASGVDVLRRYDVMDRWAEQTAVAPSRTGEGAHRVLTRRSWTYDSLGRPLVAQDARWGDTRFEYDPLGQLVAAHRQKLREVFEYDAAGALQEALSKLGASPWYIEEGNRVRRTRDCEYEYDERGRRAKATRLEAGRPTALTTSYRWDVRDRLRAVSLPDGTVVKYFYDAFGRRVRKEIRAPGSDGPRVVEYVWDCHVLASEIDSEKGVRVYVHEFGTFVPLLHQERGRVYAYINDQVGTPKELIDDQGEVVWAACHSTWGSILGTQSTAARVTTPFRHLGQYHDEETGLHYTWHRYFDPLVARWLSPDPLGLRGGNNLFGYNGSPTWLVDPLGLIVETHYYEPSYVGNVPRPMGAEAVIAPLDLGTGTDASDSIKPPGFITGKHPHHHERGHLIGRDLGGDGGTRMNLVTITGYSNYPTMYSSEAQVYALVESGRIVRVRVTPQYAGDDLIPHTIKYEAFDTRTGQRLFCNHIVNGYQKKNKCCG